MGILLDLCLMTILHMIEGRPGPEEFTLEWVLFTWILIQIEEPLAGKSGSSTRKVALVLLLYDSREDGALVNMNEVTAPVAVAFQHLLANDARYGTEKSSARPA